LYTTHAMKQVLFSLLLVLSAQATSLVVEPAPKKLWEVTPMMSVSTSNNVGELLVPIDPTLLAQFSYGVNVGRVIKEDIFDGKGDIVMTLGAHYHDERGVDHNTAQNTILFKAVWKSFPWNHKVRTIAEVGTGASYTWRILEGEKQNRSGRESRNLLNYNEFSLGFNLGDLIGFDSLDDSWLMLGIMHRSGARGVWGSYTDEDGSEQPMKGAYNAYYSGVKVRF